jgi:hypothetical protein
LITTILTPKDATMNSFRIIFSTLTLLVLSVNGYYSSYGLSSGFQPIPYSGSFARHYQGLNPFEHHQSPSWIVNPVSQLRLRSQIASPNHMVCFLTSILYWNYKFLWVFHNTIWY